MLDFRQLIANEDAANLNRTCNAVFANREGDGWSSEDRAAVADARRRFHDALDQRADMYTHPEGAVPPTVRMLLEDWISRRTPTRRAQLAFLTEAGRRLGESLPYEATLKAVAKLAEPTVAD